MKRQWIQVAAAVATVGTVGTASGDWPMARHDPQRTGLATGTSNITNPRVTWRYYLGGDPADDTLVVDDFSGDGSPELALVSGGSLQLYSLDGTLQWTTPNAGFDRVYGPVDLDGDDRLEILVRSPGQVHIVSALAGVTLWSSPLSILGPISVVRTGDLTGDGVTDLLITECGCCAGLTGNHGYAYSFASGLGSPEQLWQVPVLGCGSARAVTLVDATGNGVKEVLLSTAKTLRLYDGFGHLLAETADLGNWTSISQCRPADLNGDGPEEVVCITNTNLAPDLRRVFAVRFDGVASLATLWELQLAPEDGDIAFADPVVDLEGDSRPEVVLSAADGDGVWTTFVLDGLTGVSSGGVPGKIQGVTSFISGSRLILVGEEETDAWVYDGSGMALAWSLADRVGFVELDRVLGRSSYLGTKLVTPDINGDGSWDLAMTSVSNPRDLEVRSATLEDTFVQFSVEVPDADFSRAWTVPATVDSFGGLAATRTDGHVVVFESPTSGETTSVIEVGGYYAPGAWRDLSSSPVVAQLDAEEPDSIVIPNSRGTLLCLDAREASLLSPPRIRWEQPRTTSPSIHPASQNEAGFIIAFHRNSLGDNSLIALDPNGAVRWEQRAPATPLLDAAFGNFDGDGVPDVAFFWGAPSDLLLHIRALSGISGSTLWESSAYEPGAGRSPAGLSIGSWGGDQLDDVYFQGPRTTVLSGSSGAELIADGASAAYGLLTLFDVDNDGEAELTLHATNAESQVLESDLSTSLWTANEDLAYPYGAIVSCPAGPRLAQGSWEHPNRLRITHIGGSVIGSSTMVFLDEGSARSSEGDVQSAGGRQLTAVSAHENLTGAGHPSVVVGSADGWLYAVNPCNGELDFSLNLGAPVGGVAFGDTDADGLDEILTTVADGTLVAIRHSHAQPPSYIWDIDPPHGINDRDIDNVENSDQLSARWGPVVGATGYAVAAVDEAGEHVTDPPWRDVGTDLQHTLTGLNLQDGATYYYGVRALTDTGSSVAAVSDGVTVTLIPAGGSAGIAGQSSAGWASTAGTGGVSPEGGFAGVPESPVVGGTMDSREQSDEVFLSGRACTCQMPSRGRFSAVLGILALCFVIRGRRHKKF